MSSMARVVAIAAASAEFWATRRWLYMEPPSIASPTMAIRSSRDRAIITAAWPGTGFRRLEGTRSPKGYPDFGFLCLIVNFINSFSNIGLILDLDLGWGRWAVNPKSKII